MQLMARTLPSQAQRIRRAIVSLWGRPTPVCLKFAPGMHLNWSCIQLDKPWFTLTFYGSLLRLGAVLIGGMIAVPATAQPSPPFAANITLSPKFSPDLVELRGIGGGSIAVQDVAGRRETQTGPCNGFVDAEPDHTVVLSAFFSHLSLKVQSPQDTTLVIKGPGGIWCNDDHEGKNPGIAGEWLAGTYQIWVGSYDKTRYVPYILNITEAR